MVGVIKTALMFHATLTLAACQPAGLGERQSPSEARFEIFIYKGTDSAPSAAPGAYRNPILAGFYPDPSITKAGEDYYLVNSTFSWFPGIPVFKSRDLVNWIQIGNVVDRPSMVDFKNLGVSRGLFAPTIEHHEGVFYVANTCVECGGNFIVTAQDPAGPWSDPVWLPSVGGIDPSLFFDDDGSIYLLNNDAPPGEARYDGHRAIWIRKIDPQTFQPLEEQRALVDGGVRPEEQPVWIEGPHLYKVDGLYFLSAAEGGTEVNHSQVVLRAKTPYGPYTAYEGNPILTQRDLPEGRSNPVTSVGHADIIDAGEAGWQAVFLGVRPYEGDYYNAGRETFLTPVSWVDGWPVILPRGKAVPLTLKRPVAKQDAAPAIPMRGAFTLIEHFDDAVLAPYWLSLRGSPDEWLRIKDGSALLTLQDEGLGEFGRPAFLARRQQHMHAEVETVLHFTPHTDQEEAGLTAFQNDEYFYALSVTMGAGEGREVQLRRRAGPDTPVRGEVIASARLENGTGLVGLRIRARGGAYDFEYAEEGGTWQVLAADLDGKILSTRTAGGFVGAMFGIYAVR